MAKKRHPDDYRQAMWWRDAGSTYREIGENFGVTASRAMQMVARGEREALTRPAEKSHSAQYRRIYRERRDRLGLRRWVRHGAGDLSWQWRDWNEWVATPHIAAGASSLDLPTAVSISWPA